MLIKKINQENNKKVLLNSSEIYYEEGGAILNSFLHNKFNTYYDTTANDIQECLRLKLQYGNSICGANSCVFIPGGWGGHNYGCSIYFNIQNGGCKYLIFFFGGGEIYTCKFLNNNYEYYKISLTKIS